MLTFATRGGEENEEYIIGSDDDFGFPVIYRQWSQRTVLFNLPPILPLARSSGD
jgi:hypothetical protein